MPEYPTQELAADIARSLEPGDFDQAARFAVAHFDRINEEAAAPLACRAGCSICCSLRVDVFAHEIFLIAHHIQNTFTAAEREALLDRLETHFDKVSALTPFEHATTNLTCAMLRFDGRCGIYEVRPHSCRRHHSLDLQACIYTFDHPADLETPAAHQRELYRALTEAMVQNAEVYAEAGYDYTIYELGTALFEALCDPAAWPRWLNREPAFLHASVTPAG